MTRRAMTTVALALLAALAGAACGGDDDGAGGGSGDTGKLTTLRAGVSSIGDLAPIYLGQKKGFFAKQGLKLDLQPQQGGAVTVTGVVSGDFDFGYSNTTSLLVAQARNLPLVAIAPAAQVGTDPKTEDYTAIMVKPDSPISSPEDLAGRTLAANTLESQTDSTVKAALDAKGVDPSKVKFTEVPFPDQLAALQKGSVQAITPIEPFVTLAKDAGMRTVLPGYFSTGIPNYTTGAYFVNKRFLQEKPDVAKRLRTAIQRSLEYAQSHEQEVRETIPTFTSIKPDLAKRVALPMFPATFDRESLDRLADLIVKYRLAEKRPDVDAVLEGTG
jgi:NitT/TauT family transport system substrate-binding protein